MPSAGFYTPSATSYRTVNSFAAVRTDLERALARCSVYFEQDEARTPYFYECTAVRQGAQVAFDISIYAASPSSADNSPAHVEHLVDVEQMSGCRFAFSEAAADLAENLQFCSRGAFGSKTAMPSCPPPPPPMAPHDEAAAAANAALCAEHLLSMLGKNSPVDHKMQAVRAVGALAQQQQPPQVFTDSRWRTVAERVSTLAAGGGSTRGVALAQCEELQVVSMAALANLVALESTWAGDWLNGAAAEAVAGGITDDNHHLRREALRATVDLARTSAPQLFRRGIVPHLERISGGADDGECEDIMMAQFAESALVACRA